MMTAARIRAAAELLRERASEATPGPWYSTEESHRYGALVGPARKSTRADEVDGYGGELIGESVEADNRAYLQVVNPAVGLALAAVLDAEAGPIEALEVAGFTDGSAVLPELAALVEAIEGAGR
jgi:hypothetical protein